MAAHLIFIFYLIIFLFSTIGYGFLFSRTVNKDFYELNIGHQGIIGFFFLSLISILSSFFFKHGYFHNSILHLVGITSFVFHVKLLKKKFEVKNLLLVLLLIFVSTYVYKNHDDFPYYHLTYALNLSENSFAIGMGNFGHGFRTFSNLFYYHSILFMPLIKFYLFHIGPFFILLFFNFIVLTKLIEQFKSENFDFFFYFSLLSFVFINITFYRIGEHGTDRSAQILLILIFIYFFEILQNKFSQKKMLINFSFLLIIIFLASSMKVIYYLYILLIPAIFFVKKLPKLIMQSKNFVFVSFLFLSLFLNILTNILNTGCLLYPVEKTCFFKTEWSIPKDEVKRMSLHYEWWSKAGGGPNYTSEISPKKYVKNFNWVSNWTERHFFNKVSDTLLGIIFISIIIYISFKFFSNNKSKFKGKPKIRIFMYITSIFFLVEWFLNHPSMRYGGYVLFAIPFFIFTASHIERLIVDKINIKKLLVFFICLTIILFNVRNIFRIDKEIKVYNYDLIKSPFFFVKSVNSIKISESDDYTIYSTEKSEMCWASKTPCSNTKNLKSKKLFGFNMIIRDN